MRLVDLRSDTVTKPTDGMRAAMASAEVGDDVFGEDPTVRELEEQVAALLGKEAALFVPSGTMSNQLALLLHTRPGDEVIVAQSAHMAWDESGAGAALAGIQFREVGAGGAFGPDDVSDARKPDRYMHPRTSLVCVENTHNRSGGRIFPAELLTAATARARELGLALHLDGARLWNAACATGHPVDAYAKAFDTVSVCFSKGLGAPVGSALAGSREAMHHAKRLRKMLGGGMRQAGVLAAAALFALRHHRERLALDHEHARLLGQALAEVPGFVVAEIETNIVIAHRTDARAGTFAKALATRGVLSIPFDDNTLRLVTHLDVSREEALRAAKEIRELRFSF